MNELSVEVPAEPEALDRATSALACGWRRAVLAYSEERAGRTAALGDVAEYVAARASDPAASAPWIRARLHHIDFPTLQAADLVTDDPETNTLEYRRSPATTGGDDEHRLEVTITEAR
jgi:hypothetical protein